MRRLPSLVDLGWDPMDFMRALEEDYFVVSKHDGKEYSYAKLIEESPVIREFSAFAIKLIIRGGRVMICISKSRKWGFTTWIECFIHHVESTVPGIDAGIVSHKEDGVARCADMIWQFQKRIPLARRPNLSRASDTELRFGTDRVRDLLAGAVKRDSVVNLETCKSKNPLAGYNPRIVQFNETGKFEIDRVAIDNLMANVMNAIPENGPVVIFNESTAKGMDTPEPGPANLHHRLWKQAWANTANGRVAQPGEWIPFFAPAYKDPALRMAVPVGYRWSEWPFPKDLIREDIMRRELGVSDEFLLWRRNKLTQELNYNFTVFMEDYPCFPDDPFQATQARLFAQHHIDTARSYVIDTPENFDLRLEPHDAPFGPKAITGW